MIGFIVCTFFFFAAPAGSMYESTAMRRSTQTSVPKMTAVRPSTVAMSTRRHITSDYMKYHNFSKFEPYEGHEAATAVSASGVCDFPACIGWGWTLTAASNLACME